MIEEGALVIDVRTIDEYEDGHLPNAINIPVGELIKRAAQIIPKDKPVLLYCESGSRSAMGAMLLKTMGYHNVTNAGGIADLPEF
jgi:Rhodanese-related sulfurtransferase